MLNTFTHTAKEHGYPASTLTDNGMVYTVRLAGGKNSGVRTSLEAELFRLGITQKNGSPHHPQTQGKVERFQQTLKKWLRAQTQQPTMLTELQLLLDKFADEYNQRRPHRSLEHRATPFTAYTTSIKATPSSTPREDSHHRVRHDRIDKSGTVSLRVAGHLRHIGVGRTHAGTHVTLLIQELDVTIINAATGKILRELNIDLNRDYQPAGTKKIVRTHKTWVQTIPMSCDITWRYRWDLNPRWA